MPRVNHKILTWARETAGLSLAAAAQKLDLREARGVGPADRLAALEAGKVAPSRPLILKMAKHYRRPLLTFYLSEPPRKGDRGQDFRTLPMDHSEADEALLDALIRDVRARQSLVCAALADEEETGPLSFVGSMHQSDGVGAVLQSIRMTLDLSLDEFRAARNSDEAFSLLRSKAENEGVFVLLIGNLGSYHTAISLETFRGFALADEIAPFVIINDQDSRAAWAFTLLHELAHLWLGETGVSGGTAERSVERFCNDVASEFLLPRGEVGDLQLGGASKVADMQPLISEFATARNISRSMVAYRLFCERVISKEVWHRLSSRFRKQWLDQRERQRERSRAQDGGPNYYTIRRHRVGAGLIELVTRMMTAGEITTAKAGQVLGVRIKQVQSLVDNPGRMNRAY